MTRVIGIDPATTSGWAFREGECMCFGEVTVRNRTDVLEVLQRAKAAGVELAVIEDAFLEKNVRTFGHLRETHGYWKARLDDVGIGCEMVSASTWKTAMLVWDGKRPANNRDAQKEWAVAQARKEGYTVVKTDNEADAIYILLWAEAQARLKERSEK